MEFRQEQTSRTKEIIWDSLRIAANSKNRKTRESRVRLARQKFEELERLGVATSDMEAVQERIEAAEAELEYADDTSSASAPSATRNLEKHEHNLYGAILYGIEGRRIELQARYFGVDEYNDPGPWGIRITGMARGAIAEVQARIHGAFAKFGLRPPQGHILINLAPADLPKQGTSLDLPIAMICLQAAGYAPDLPPEIEKTYLFLGELSLHGEICRIPGALAIALSAPSGSMIVVPKGNEKECCAVKGLPDHRQTRVAIADNLEQVLNFMRGTGRLTNAMSQPPEFENIIPRAPDFADVKGQEQAKRALTVAAAGGHNVLMVGPPGEGKSLLASALAGILPPLSNAEKIELTKLYSAKGLLAEDGMIVGRRPFRSVHHTASKESLIGGGSGIPAPGEITLAHHGILFLDELPEFSRATIESLRQPLEAGCVTVSRVDASLTFPSRFTLVAAMNPCPCGFHGQFLCADCLCVLDDSKSACPRCGKLNVRHRCECKPAKVQNYRKTISGPILDRIDLHVELKALSVEEKFSQEKGISSKEIRQKVESARGLQHQRFGEEKIACNAAIPGGEILKWCVFSDKALQAYKETIAQGLYTTRATDRMAKVARTIADLDGSEKVEEPHIYEAAEFLSGSPLA
jgi:magnesium chelatase family protein